MCIANLPREKNITDFTDDELFRWLKNYIGSWASDGVTSQAHFEVVQVELTRRSNERILNLTTQIHSFTKVLVVLTIILVILTIVLVVIPFV